MRFQNAGKLRQLKGKEALLEAAEQSMRMSALNQPAASLPFQEYQVADGNDARILSSSPRHNHRLLAEGGDDPWGHFADNRLHEPAETYVSAGSGEADAAVKMGASARGVLLRCLRSASTLQNWLWGRVLQVELFLSTYCMKALPAVTVNLTTSMGDSKMAG